MMLTTVLALLLQELGPGERLDGLQYTGPKEARFLEEAHARAYLETHAGKGELRRDGDAWVVRVLVTVALLEEMPRPPIRFVNGVFHTPTGSRFTTRNEAEAFAKANPHVEGIRETTVQGKTSFDAYWTDKEDLVAKARKALAEEGLCDPWLLRTLPKPWTLTRCRYVANDPNAHPFGAVRYVFGDLDSEENTRAGASFVAKFYVPDAEHQVLRPTMFQDWTLRRVGDATVVESRDATGWFVRWKHRAGGCMEISAFHPYDEALVAAHLARFPSAWPKDFAIDRTAWARAEAEFRLRRMKEELETPPAPGSRLQPYNAQFKEIVRWFDVPLFWNVFKSRTIEERREHHRKLSAWWAQAGPKAEPRRQPLSVNAVYSLSATLE